MDTNHQINWPLVIITGIFISNLTGLFLIYRTVKTISPPPSAAKINISPTPPDSDRLTQIEQELADLRSQLQSLHQQVLSSSAPPQDSLSAVLPDLAPIASQSAITISDSRFATVEVHDLPLASSKVVGHLDFGRSYPYTSHQGDWYQVQLSGGIFGWVSAQLVKPL